MQLCKQACEKVSKRDRSEVDERRTGEAKSNAVSHAEACGMGLSNRALSETRRQDVTMTALYAVL